MKKLLIVGICIVGLGMSCTPIDDTDLTPHLLLLDMEGEEDPTGHVNRLQTEEEEDPHGSGYGLEGEEDPTVHGSNLEIERQSDPYNSASHVGNGRGRRATR